MEDVITMVSSKLRYVSSVSTASAEIDPTEELTTFCRLEQFWKDSQMLAQSGADVFDDAAVGNQNALAALLGYFGITGTSDEGLVDIKGILLPRFGYSNTY